MPLIVIGSVTGAPGVTCASAALTAAWPDPHCPAVLAEMDPTGGDLAVRFGVAPGIGVSSLAAATGAGPVSAATVLTHARRLSVAGLTFNVLIGPVYRREAAAAAGRLADTRTLAGHQELVIFADVGRIAISISHNNIGVDIGTRLLNQADLLLIATTSQADALAHVTDMREDLLRASGNRLRLMLIGDLEYPSDEVAHGTGIPVIGVLPHDRQSAAAFRGHQTLSRGPRRSPTLRAATQVTATLKAIVEPPMLDMSPTTASSSAGVPTARPASQTPTAPIPAAAPAANHQEAVRTPPTVLPPERTPAAVVQPPSAPWAYQPARPFGGTP